MSSLALSHIPPGSPATSLIKSGAKTSDAAAAEEMQ
jgi:hypothetical protein